MVEQHKHMKYVLIVYKENNMPPIPIPGVTQQNPAYGIFYLHTHIDDVP